MLVHVELTAGQAVGVSTHSLISVSQLAPVKPVPVQVQVYFPGRSLQRPLFWHGELNFSLLIRI